MFNAIFGGIFNNNNNNNNSKQSESNVENERDSTTDTGETQIQDQSTQTGVNNNNSKNKSGPGPAKVKRSYSAVVASNLKKIQKKDDWVLIDRNEEADKVSNRRAAAAAVANTRDANTITEQSMSNTNVKRSLIDDTGDIMLRSFFDRAAAEQETTTSSAKQQNNGEQWLITPLPCLTSINSTQRSMIDENPNENLFIEQPAVFMKPAAVAEAPKPTVRRSYSCIVKSTAEKRKIEEPKQQPTAAPAIRAAVKRPVVVKAIVEEEPELEPIILPIPQPETETETESTIDDKSSKSSSQTSSPQSTRRAKKETAKKNKKNNKENISNNKENTQVKILLMSDLKKSTSAPRISDILFSCNKKQMKRNNKNMISSSGSSLKQRKYHNLQQPSSFSNSSNY